MKKILVLVVGLTAMSCRHAPIAETANLTMASQGSEPLVCDVDVADGLSTKDRRDQFWFYDVDSRDTKVKWVSFVRYNGPDDDGFQKVLTVKEKTLFRCPGCYEFIAEANSPDTIFKLSVRDGATLTAEVKNSDGSFSKFGLKDGQCKKVAPSASSSQKSGACVRYAVNNPTVSMKLDACMDHSSLPNKKSKLDEGRCTASHEQEVFGNTTRAIRKKFVYFPGSANCSDPKIPLLQSSP